MTKSSQMVFQGLTTAVLMLLSVWTATQWAVATLKFHPALGTPWVSLFGWPVYAPWQPFPWWLTFGSAAPRVLDTAGLMAAAGGILGGLIAISGAAWRASKPKTVTTYGSARWADVGDMQAAGLFRERGVMLGQAGSSYLRDDGPHHVLAVAPTRSGKGVGLVVPTLLSWTGSAVIHDIKGENWQLTSGWRQRFSNCLKFDPTDAGSARFNPLLEVRKGPNEVRDVQNIADILIDPEGAREVRDHWQKTAHSLLVGAILHVLYAEEEKTLARVARLLSDPSRSIDRTFWATLTTNHLGADDAPEVHPTVAEHAHEVLNKVPNERSGVVSTAVSLLSLYPGPIIAKTTGTASRASQRPHIAVVAAAPRVKPMEEPYTIYLSKLVADRFDAVARVNGAKSALVERALDRQLDPDRIQKHNEALLRRMNGVVKGFADVQRDVAIATETLSLYVRYFLTITPSVPKVDQEAARALGRERFQVFVAQVGRRLATDHRLISGVLESIVATNPDLLADAIDNGPLKPRPPNAEVRPFTAKAVSASNGQASPPPPEDDGHV